MPGAMCGASGSVIGGPLSGNLLLLDGWHGLAGWQWVFLLEGIPAVLLALACPFLMCGWVEDAHFLRPDERLWLRQRLEAENQQFGCQTLTLVRAINTDAADADPGLPADRLRRVFEELLPAAMIKGMGFTDQGSRTSAAKRRCRTRRRRTRSSPAAGCGGRRIWGRPRRRAASPSSPDRMLLQVQFRDSCKVFFGLPGLLDDPQPRGLGAGAAPGDEPAGGQAVSGR